MWQAEQLEAALDSSELCVLWCDSCLARRGSARLCKASGCLAVRNLSVVLNLLDSALA